MPEFLTLLPPAEALAKVLPRVSPLSRTEEINTADALGRVLTEPVKAPQALPNFRRTTVDGFALRAGDTFGASDSIPMYLTLIGEVPMGGEPAFSIQATQCALIHTGGMLPQGADAVVMVENTQPAGDQQLEVLRAVSVGENVIQVGEDVIEGEIILTAGFLLRPAEIGGLMALGTTKVNVVHKPRVGIISSGDEVVSPGVEARPGQVRDINSYTLAALIEKTGGIPQRYGIVADRFDTMRQTSAEALGENDMLVITAGSSASTRDLTAKVIDSLGEPGVLVHGVNVRPGKPTILGVCDGKPVVGLPGNPVSALVIAGLFVTPLIEWLSGREARMNEPSIEATLSINLSSKTGREDWVPVQLSETSQGWQAEPIFGKSNLIFTLIHADGLVRIEADANGLAAGELVKVWLM